VTTKHDTDKDFETDFDFGTPGERRVVALLQSRGLDVTWVEKELRPEFEDRARYSDQGVDILIGDWPFGIKTRHLDFSGPEDFPYPTIFLEETDRWERCERKPLAFIIANEEGSGGMVALCRDCDRMLWRKQGYWHKSGRRVECWAAPTSSCEDLEAFIVRCRRIPEMCNDIDKTTEVPARLSTNLEAKTPNVPSEQDARTPDSSRV
jgi:hypothetical protein